MSRKNKPHTALFEFLVKRGVDVNTVDSEQNTALHHLAMQNMHIRSPKQTLKVFHSLVKAGALTNLVNSQGKTCLELFGSGATFREFLDILYK